MMVVVITDTDVIQSLNIYRCHLHILIASSCLIYRNYLAICPIGFASTVWGYASQFLLFLSAHSHVRGYLDKLPTFFGNSSRTEKSEWLLQLNRPVGRTITLFVSREFLGCYKEI